jgi:hypothetical protein
LRSGFCVIGKHIIYFTLYINETSICKSLFAYSTLPHPLLQETSDVALIVKDLEPKKRRPDNDAVIDLYERRIAAHGISHPIKVR